LIKRHNDIDNTGKIEADGGNVTITGPLSGAGQIEIFSGNRVTLESSASNDVTFEPGGVASLILQHAQGFIGTVAGLAQSDGIDLVNFLFSGHPTISNVTGTGNAGTDTDVTIKDGRRACCASSSTQLRGNLPSTPALTRSAPMPTRLKGRYFSWRRERRAKVPVLVRLDDTSCSKQGSHPHSDSRASTTGLARVFTQRAYENETPNLGPHRSAWLRCRAS
jgi:hypothetical protein